MSATESPPVGHASLWKVAIPSEHGGWSLTLEPSLMGLIVAPSIVGAALAGVALVAFLLRTPLKLALVDLLRHRRMRRTELAAAVAGGYSLLLACLLATVSALGDPSLWQPLAIALPLFLIELAYDIRSKGRRLVPEIVGTVGIGSVAAAIVLADGGSKPLAYGLWFIAASRAVAAVPFVRFQLRRARGQSARVAGSDAAQALALAIAAFGVAVTDVPAAAALAIAGLAAFHIVSARLGVSGAPMIGAQQVVLGLTVVLITGLSAIAP
jgi:hypothetical protein